MNITLYYSPFINLFVDSAFSEHNTEQFIPAAVENNQVGGAVITSNLIAFGSCEYYLKYFNVLVTSSVVKHLSCVHVVHFAFITVSKTTLSACFPYVLRFVGV